MDPNRTLYEALNALDHIPNIDTEDPADWRLQAIDALDSLARWLRKGGFSPDVWTVLRNFTDHASPA